MHSPTLPDGMSVQAQAPAEPERGERRKFWTDSNAQRRYLSRRGRRSPPAEQLIADADGDHWAKVEETETRGVAVYEWQPPEPEPEPEVEEEPEPEPEPEPELKEEPKPDEMVTEPPLGAPASVLAETEHGVLFQQGSHYVVENTETGDSLALPGDEWEQFASYLKRGSRMA